LIGHESCLHPGREAFADAAKVLTCDHTDFLCRQLPPKTALEILHGDIPVPPVQPVSNQATGAPDLGDTA
jgi:hypothetical protein